MKILFDSYYFFPFIQVSVDNCSSDQLLGFLQDPKLMIYRSEITMFELAAKGSKYIHNRILTIEDLTTGLNALHFTQKIHVIPIYFSGIQILANQLHASHSDFIDCVILASAASFTEMFLTEDHGLIEKSRTGWHDLLLSQNPDFRVITMTQFRSELAL